MNESSSDLKPSAAARYLPVWLARYHWRLLPADLLAGAVVAMMLVPQSMAYAMLAGLPPELGMYASILPLIAYALFGSSMTLAVGPMAVTSLMTAAALAPLAFPGSAAYIAGAQLLALLSGALLFVFGVLRLGFIAKLLSGPVVSGFISGSSLLIVAGQLGPLLGVGAAPAPGHGPAALLELLAHGLAPQPATLLVGLGALVALILARFVATGLGRLLGLAAGAAALLPKLAPMAVLLAAIALATLFDLGAHGVAVVGPIVAGLPPLALPSAPPGMLRALLLPACMIALINFVGSIAVAQTFAARRRERVDADAELRGLGAANLASALSGGLAVSGGLARSAVNFAAGARTPLAGVIAALLMAVIVAACTSLFAALPVAVLAATIIVAVAPGIDIGAFRRAWAYDRADALALAGTAIGVVALGVEAGIAIGVGWSLVSLVWRSSNPHIAVLGRVPFTEQFRNVLRYNTETLPQVLALRIDENLVFANAGSVEERVRAEMAQRPQLAHVLLVLSSVSQIDATGIEMLLELNTTLRERGIRLHLAEVKGPLLERLQRSPLLVQLSGPVFLSTHQAFLALSEVAEDYSI